MVRQYLILESKYSGLFDFIEQALNASDLTTELKSRLIRDGWNGETS